MARIALLALVALGAPWWWKVLTSLLADVAAAGEPAEAEPEPRAGRRATLHLARAVDAEARAPLNRVLAFRGVARRVAARRRWEAGFGRRGL